MNQDKIRELYNLMTLEEQSIFTMGRESVLNDFDAVCQADAFVGFSDSEWSAIKKFFKFNNTIRAVRGN